MIAHGDTQKSAGSTVPNPKLRELKIYVREDQLAWLNAEARRREQASARAGYGRKSRRNEVIKEAIDDMMIALCGCGVLGAVVGAVCSLNRPVADPASAPPTTPESERGSLESELAGPRSSGNSGPGE
jgi:hypothetical protein